MVKLIKEFKYTYMFVVPNFELNDTGSRSLDTRFLLDTRLGSLDGILRYSDGVRLATQMLVKSSDRRAFVQIAKILAFDEIQRGGSDRIHPIGGSDIAELQRLQGELN